jgi:hypothetical protein
MRLYADDFRDKLFRFNVKVVTAKDFLDPQQIVYYNLNAGEELFVCEKPMV